MDRLDRKNKRGKKVPRVPIKTYKWEDVKRSRKRGGYPWTYLYKNPFDEIIDPKQFIMDTFKRSQSKDSKDSSDTMEIHEMSSDDGKYSPEKNDSLQIVTEPDDHSINSARDQVDKPEITNIESAESSDNISQYLDKEDPIPIKPPPEEEEPKSEERKRKLSAESGYSKLSITKQNILKTLKDTKQKIKVPKISLPVSKIRKHLPRRRSKSASPEMKKKDAAKITTAPTVDVKPVYVHIPLKPPEGQTDEFSYLEFGDKKPAAVKAPRKLNPMFKEALKNLKKMEQEQLKEEAEVITNDDSIENIDTTEQFPSDENINQEDKNKENEKNFNKLFEASENPPQRARSEEPERKRKLSMESSYSRKSLSKLGIMKKLKDASDKIKYATLTLTKKKPKTETPIEPTKKEIKKVTTPPENIKPVYIHIPLKPAEGSSDEFSHLEFADKKPESVVATTPPEKDVTSSPESPVTSEQNDSPVQFIFLTAPSDDEILDDHSPEIPETPSSENKTFFANRIDELKELAKGVADRISPETRRKQLAAVTEEKTSISGSNNEDDEDVVDPEKLQVPLNFELQPKKDEIEDTSGSTKKIVVDEEDGLKFEVEKSNLKSENSPVSKKKVSFKRRSKTNSKEEIYEDIQAPEKVQSPDQSMSVDEEKSYLDEEKIVKSTSLEEDYNKWSKLRTEIQDGNESPSSTNKTISTSDKNLGNVKLDESQRKRKLESESKINLAKDNIVRTIKETKQKIKIPKMSVPVSKIRKYIPKRRRSKSSSPEMKKKDVGTISIPPIDVKPVYQHIPLKPAEGQTDEFSYLEFGDKKPTQRKLNPVFKGIFDNIKKMKEQQQETGQECRNSEAEVPDSKTEEEPIPVTEPKQQELSEPVPVIEPKQQELSKPKLSVEKRNTTKENIMNTLRSTKKKIKVPKISIPVSKIRKHIPRRRSKSSSPELKKKDMTNISILTADVQPVYHHIPLKPPEGETDEFSYLEFGDKKPVVKTPRKLNPAFKDVFDNIKKLKEQQLKDENIEPNSSKTEMTQEENEPVSKPRAKSEEPQHKRDLSLEKLGITKKIKDASDKIKGASEKIKYATLTLTKKKKKTKPKVPITKKDDCQAPIVLENVKPVYIHIPLKAPEGSAGDTKPNVVRAPRKLNPIFKEALKNLKKMEQQQLTEEPKTDEDSNKDKNLVDEEDGLKLESSKSANSKEGIYEDVQVPENERKQPKKKPVEDDSKWSKSSDHDHEYEPVNPPPDNIVHTITTNEALTPPNTEPSKASSITSLDRRMLGGSEEEGHEIKRRVSLARVNEPFLPSILTTNMTTNENQQVQSSDSAPTTTNSETTGKFQKAIKEKADQFKTKLQGIKKPNLTLPHPPKFQKPNFDRFKKMERPKFNLPKMPETPKIHFSLPRKLTKKRSLQERQFSTESTAGDSKKPIFDFSTYPRIFKKKPKSDFESSNDDSERPPQPPPVEFATVPRTKQSVRVPLHAEDSVETDRTDESVDKQDYEEREDSVERRMASHIRYDEDIDIDDEINERERENQAINSASPYHRDFNSRWNHGNFIPQPNKEYIENIKNSEYRVTDLDSPEDIPEQSYTSSKEKYSSEDSSLGIHRRGVLEEINPDEFFLRQKGISQDNIDVGMYLSSEIREAFRTPMNALSQIENDNYPRQYDDGSNQSLPETPTRKPLRKPKRKKTPHVSQEQIKYEESEPEEYREEIPPPSRPKRKSKRNKKDKNIIPYQETITVDEPEPHRDDFDEGEDIGILGKSIQNYKLLYENEQMQGKEQPEIQITDTYRNLEYMDNSFEHLEGKPPAPPRRQKSLKSLSLSEHNSILDDLNMDKEMNILNVETDIHHPHQRSESFDKDEIHEYIVPEIKEAPKRPFRVRSRTRSHSRGTSQQPDEESQIPESPVPCTEEPCIQDIRDSMGYAVIDKQKGREPPLPPPRTPPRRRRSLKSSKSETKFFTVPRSLNDEEPPPSRPLRNYSTLSQTKSRTTKTDDDDDNNKENIDIEQYIEILEEPNRDLQSGEVLQKMRDRPLPAPPRPPRKTKILRDITSQENIMSDDQDELQKRSELDETEIDHFEDTIETEPEPEPTITIERHLITPTHYTHEETVTHAALVVQPLDGAKILPDSELIRESRERIIPITKESDYDDETSEIPEDFKQLKDPEPIKTVIEPDVNTEVEILRTQKLQVQDLDVDRLTVNELTANKIVVSEIDSSSINVNDINSRTGALKIGELELPPSIVQDLIEKLRAAAAAELQARQESENLEQKKTSIEKYPVEFEHSPRKLEELRKPIVDDSEQDEEIIFSDKEISPTPEDEEELQMELRNLEESPDYSATAAQDDEIIDEIPQRSSKEDVSETELKIETTDFPIEPEIDDEIPPPRPPQPHISYLPSQPPSSFYALKAQKYVDTIDDDIPVVPRRRRQPKPPISRSTSEESAVVPSTARRHFNRPPTEPSIPQLTGQLLSACGTAANNSLKRLITYVTNNVLGNADGTQDMNVMMVILLVLIAGLILLGYGDEKTVVHLHHWEYFNPPRDM